MEEAISVATTPMRIPQARSRTSILFVLFSCNAKIALISSLLADRTGSILPTSPFILARVSSASFSLTLCELTNSIRFLRLASTLFSSLTWLVYERFAVLNSAFLLPVFIASTINTVMSIVRNVRPRILRIKRLSIRFFRKKNKISPKIVFSMSLITPHLIVRYNRLFSNPSKSSYGNSNSTFPPPTPPRTSLPMRRDHPPSPASL